jgi:type II secretory pathway pseudopilin PulG
MSRNLKNQNGYTVIEVLVAGGIMVVSFFAIISNFVQMAQANKRTGDIYGKSQSIYSYIDSVKTDAATMQKNFSSVSVTTSSILDPSKLVLGYQKNYLGPATGCKPNIKSCDAYLGYTLRPINGLSGLFEGTLVIYNIAKDLNGQPILDAGGNTTFTNVDTGKFILNNN